MNPLQRHLCLWPLLIGLTACVPHPAMHPPLQPLELATGQAEAPVVPDSVWRRSDWWQAFADPQLSALITQALQANPDLQATRARLERAAAIAGASAASLWPRLDATGSVTRTRFSAQGEIPPPFAGSISNVNEAALEGVWEFDFFGRNREALQAAIGTTRAVAAEHQAAGILLASDIARRYFDLARQLSQRELLQQHVERQHERQRLLQRRHDAGIDSRDVLDEAHAQLQESTRELAALDGGIEGTHHVLATLLGKAPDALQTLTAQLPATTAFPVPPRLPADLLGHRADIVAARWRVEAARHQLASTRAGFYPNIDLRAFTGYSSIGTLDHWLEAASRQSGIGVAFNLPLFNAGRLRAEYRARSAEADLAIAGYNATLLNALRDVADELSALESTERQLQHQHSALESSLRALARSRQRHASGIGDRLEVLDAEAATYTRRSRLTELQARQTDDRIRLIRALGGGHPEDADPIATSTASGKASK